MDSARVEVAVDRAAGSETKSETWWLAASTFVATKDEPGFRTIAAGFAALWILRSILVAKTTKPVYVPRPALSLVDSHMHAPAHFLYG